jgi:hypothetical protein
MAAFTAAERWEISLLRPKFGYETHSTHCSAAQYAPQYKTY